MAMPRWVGVRNASWSWMMFGCAAHIRCGKRQMSQMPDTSSGRQPGTEITAADAAASHLVHELPADGLHVERLTTLYKFHGILFAGTDIHCQLYKAARAPGAATRLRDVSVPSFRGEEAAGLLQTKTLQPHLLSSRTGL